MQVDGYPLQHGQFVDNLGRPMAVHERECRMLQMKWGYLDN